MLKIIGKESYCKSSKTFKQKNEPIATMDNGVSDDFICLNRDEKGDMQSASSDLLPHIGEDFFTKGPNGRIKRMFKKKDIKFLMDNLQEGTDPEEFDELTDERLQRREIIFEVSEHLKDQFRKAIFNLENRFGREVSVPYSTIQPVPHKKQDQRECLYIFGPTGAGKSFYAAKYADLWLDCFPEGTIYRFSRVKEDKSFSKFDKNDLKNVIIDERMVSQPITAEQLKGSLCIFDDIDTLPDSSPEDKSIKNAVLKLREDLLQTGRHQSVYVINTSHLGMNWKGTRSSINEATSVTFFPSSGTTGGIQKFLKTYAGLSNPQIEKIIALPSRWVTLYMHSPRYILYDSGCYLL